MDEQREDEAAIAAPTRPEWIAPSVDRVVAGAAEGSADISTDGVDIPS